MREPQSQDSLSAAARSRSGIRRMMILFGIVALLFLALSAAWIYGARELTAAIDRTKQQLSARGVVAQCSAQDVRGFPFRLGLFCADVAYADPVAGVTASGGALRSAAQLYRPGHFVGELEGPLSLTLPGLAPMQIDWENLQASSRVSTAGLRRFSLVSNNAQLAAVDFGVSDPLGDVDELQVHARAGDEGAGARPQDLEVALIATQWQVEDGGTGAIPPLDFTINAVIEDGLALAATGTKPLDIMRARGLSGDVREFEIRTGNGGRFSVRGPLSADQQGLLSGELKLNVEGPELLLDFAARIFPPAREMAAPVVAALTMMGGGDGKTAQIRDLTLTIRNGIVTLGFIEIARIPPIQG